MSSIEELKEHLSSCFPDLQSGDWVNRSTGYEQSFANIIGAELDCGRYWDVVWKGTLIEVKKGNIWLDLIRFSEIVQRVVDPRAKEVVILCLKKDKNKLISRIDVIETPRLLSYLKLDVFAAEQILTIKENHSSETINMQFLLSDKAKREIRSFCIPDSGQVART